VCASMTASLAEDGNGEDLISALTAWTVHQPRRQRRDGVAPGAPKILSTAK